jgi:hypothetical protein
MNPVLQSLGMGNDNNILSTINSVKQLMGGKNPAAFAQILAQRNPQFAKFLTENKGKTPEQIAKENGLNWADIQGFMK